MSTQSIAKGAADVEAEVRLFGGSCGSQGPEGLGKLLEWFEEHVPAPRWRFLEWTDRMRLEAVGGTVAAPDDQPRFVSGRWFGLAGDLEVWRDGTSFGWRFVGNDTEPPFSRTLEGAPGGEDEATGPYAADALRSFDDPSSPGRCALLWDVLDPRIQTAAPATLELLGRRDREKQQKHLGLFYTPYYSDGVLAAVRFREIGELAPDAASGATDSTGMADGG